MKILSPLVSSLLFSGSIYAADSFQCGVTKSVVTEYACETCTDYGHDHDCIAWQPSKCLSKKPVSTGATDAVLRPGKEIILGANKSGVAFLFSMSASGYSAHLTVAAEALEGSLEVTNPLNPNYHSARLIVKTKNNPGVVGAVTEYILTCAPQ